MRFVSPFLVILLAAVPLSAQSGASARPAGDGFLLDDRQVEELMRIEDDATAQPQAQEASTEAGASNQRWRVVLRDGQVLQGRLVSQSRDEVVLEIAAGARMTLARSAIRDMQVDRGQAPAATAPVTPAPATATTASSVAPSRPTEQAVSLPPDPPPPSGTQKWFNDPNRTRGLYVPSAMMLRKGEGSVSQKELFFTSFNYGLTDWLSVQIGGVVPIWFIDGGFNLIGGVKIGGKVLDGLHLSAGAQSLVLAPAGVFGGVGFGYANATFGNSNFHATLTVGAPWMVNVDAAGVIGDLIVVGSGNLRVAENVALVTENWVFPTSIGSPGSLTHILSLAVRLMNQNLSADIGFIAVPDVPLPIPWLSGTWNFQL